MNNTISLFKKISRQAIRFGVVGFLSNILLYLLYLLFTLMGVGHKTAMTLLFAIGATQTFVFNKLWTFEHQGIIGSSLVKYFLAYMNETEEYLNNFQVTEVSKIEWKTINQCLESIRPYNLEKKELITNINKVLQEYRLYS
jgi:hypothetical protein